MCFTNSDGQPTGRFYGLFWPSDRKTSLIGSTVIRQMYLIRREEVLYTALDLAGAEKYSYR